MKSQADQHRHHEEFKEGDLVYLKLRPYKQQSVAKRRFEKLSGRYYGPFTVLARVGVVAYKLELPPISTIHPVFHISQLKRVIGTTLSSPTLPPMTPDLEVHMEPESVLRVRQRSLNNDKDLEVLIKWKSLLKFEASWESFAEFNTKFPDFHLEDKVRVHPRVLQRAAVVAAVARALAGELRHHHEIFSESELKSELLVSDPATFGPHGGKQFQSCATVDMGFIRSGVVISVVVFLDLIFLFFNLIWVFV
uniref:Chromo domain-containing protein n=1 Tax=Cannabis sativa TaxID=3483 RepID=A0A803PDP7_CANSA